MCFKIDEDALIEVQRVLAVFGRAAGATGSLLPVLSLGAG